MAKNIDFMGATFPDVPSIRLPQHEGGLVSFTDVTDTTAVASDVANGKYFYTADGEKTVGTASGGITPSGTIQISQNGQVDVTQYAIADVNVSGGGTDRLVLLKEQSLGYIQTTSTSETDTGQVIEIDRSVINSYDFLIVQISADTIVNNRHLSSVRTFHLNATSNIDTKNNSGANVVQNHKVSSNGTVTSRSGGTAYGVYPRTLSFGTDISTLPIYKRQSDTYSGAINNDYTCRVYGISFVDLIGG